MDRQEVFNYYRNNPRVSVLIIGAGVNGIGTFRDLALQNVDVLLVDRDDFCSGASAASSHMIHGGIRYLENGEFRLVREAVRERNLLIKNAPHYVKPLPTVIPIFHFLSGLLNAPLKFLGLLDKPSERGALVIRLGLVLYDAYSGNTGIVPKHEFLSKQEAHQEFPDLHQDVINAAKYYDGLLVAPERLCIDMLLDGEKTNSKAHALNYLPAVSSADGIVQLQDQITGNLLEIKPTVVINASGPWIDFTNTKLGIDTKYIGGTKGSHLILNNPNLRVAIGNNEFFFENADGRIVLISPFEDKVLIGTSDLPIEDPDSARCTDEEIGYFFDMVKVVFPSISLERDQIVFQFSGVRPLPANDSSSPGQISRDHKIQVIAPSDTNQFTIFNLIGGKWTSFRAFSEQITDRVLDELGIQREINTQNVAIGGGQGYPRNSIESEIRINNMAEISGTSMERCADLFARYGTRADEFIKLNSEAKEIHLAGLPGYSQEEILHIFDSEKVVHLDDLILRRSNIAKSGLLNRTALVELAERIGSSRMWSADQIKFEIQRTAGLLNDYHGINL
jgi:glycerol-3-phosphate dehydrogenase